MPESNIRRENLKREKGNKTKTFKLKGKNQKWLHEGNLEKIQRIIPTYTNLHKLKAEEENLRHSVQSYFSGPKRMHGS